MKLGEKSCECAMCGQALWHGRQIVAVKVMATGLNKLARSALKKVGQSVHPPPHIIYSKIPILYIISCIFACMLKNLSIYLAIQSRLLEDSSLYLVHAICKPCAHPFQACYLCFGHTMPVAAEVIDLSYRCVSTGCCNAATNQSTCA